MKFAVVALALMIPVVASLNIQCLFGSGPFGPFMPDNSYFCQVLSLKVKSANEVVNGISGDHTLDKTDNDVEVLWIIGQTCYFLPKNVASFFPNIKVLAITNSRLKGLTKEDLKVFHHLKSLYINANKLKTLQADLFSLSPKLQHIDLANNQITTLPNGIFNELEVLEQVMMEGNVCVSENFLNFEAVEELRNEIKENCQEAVQQSSCSRDPKIADEIASLKSLLVPQKSDDCGEKIANLEILVSRLIDDNLSLKKLVSKIPKQVANIMKTLGAQTASRNDVKQEESDEIEVFTMYPTMPPSSK